MKRTLRYIATSCLVSTLAFALPALAGPGRAGSWEGLTERHDLDGDGVITADEFAAGDPRFAFLDQNGDGVLTEDDLEAVRASAQAFAGARVVRLADADFDGTVAADEWRVFLEAADGDGDGLFDPADLRELAMARFADSPRPRGRRGGGGPGFGGPERGPDEGAVASILDRDQDGELEIADLDDIFVELDADADGALSEEELPRRSRRPGRRGFGPGGDGGARGQE